MTAPVPSRLKLSTLPPSVVVSWASTPSAAGWEPLSIVLPPESWATVETVGVACWTVNGSQPPVFEV